MFKRLLIQLCVAATMLAIAPAAFASGGNYVFDGGSQPQQAQVTAALNASSFPWSIVPGPVVIHIQRGVVSSAAPNQIWLDANLLDAGRFAWGVVQHEYAHQVDFALLDSATRAQLHTILGGTAWSGPEGHSTLECPSGPDHAVPPRMVCSWARVAESRSAKSTWWAYSCCTTPQAKPVSYTHLRAHET